MSSNKVTVEAKGDRELVITRKFPASADLLFQAYTECRYLKRWMYGFEGWSLSVCEIDLRVGGRYRWVWQKDDFTMGAGGEYVEIHRPDLLVTTEQFDEPWYQGEAISTVRFMEEAGVTTLENTMRYISKEARDEVLASPMEDGLSVGYERLEKLLEDAAATA